MILWGGGGGVEDIITVLTAGAISEMQIHSAMADNETPKPTMKRPTNCKIVIINDLVWAGCHQGPGEGNFPGE